jgi:thioredoxin 1
MRLMEFSAGWCAPCKVQEPIIKKWAANHPDVKLEIVGVDQPAGQAKASEYYIQSVPHLVFLDDKGTVLAAQPGVHDNSRLDAFYDQAKRRLTG